MTDIVTKSNEEPPAGGLLADYFDIEAMQKEFGVSRRTIERWNEKGIGPARTVIGRKIYFCRKTVREWLESQEERKPKRTSLRRARFGPRKSRRAA